MACLPKVNVKALATLKWYLLAMVLWFALAGRKLMWFK